MFFRWRACTILAVIIALAASTSGCASRAEDGSAADSGNSPTSSTPSLASTTTNPSDASASSAAPAYTKASYQSVGDLLDALQASGFACFDGGTTDLPDGFKCWGDAEDDPRFVVLNYSAETLSNREPNRAKWTPTALGKVYASSWDIFCFSQSVCGRLQQALPRDYQGATNDAAASSAPPTTGIDELPNQVERKDIFHVTTPDGYEAEITIDWSDQFQVITPEMDAANETVADGCGNVKITPQTVRQRRFVHVSAQFPTVNGFQWPSDRPLDVLTPTRGLPPIYTCGKDDAPGQFNGVGLDPNHPSRTIAFVIQGEKSPSNPAGDPVLTGGETIENAVQLEPTYAACTLVSGNPVVDIYGKVVDCVSRP